MALNPITCSIPTSVFFNNKKFYGKASTVLGAPAHIHVHPIVQRLEAGAGVISSRWAKGSMPDPRHPQWKAFIDHGYQHDPSPERTRSAYNEALQTLSEKDQPSHLVLVVGGDVDVEELAAMRGVLRQGGAVTLWLFKSFVDPDSQALAAQYDGRMRLQFIDHHPCMVSARHDTRDASRALAPMVHKAPSPLKTTVLENQAASIEGNITTNMPKSAPASAPVHLKRPVGRRLSLPVLMLIVMPVAWLIYYSNVVFTYLY